MNRISHWIDGTVVAGTSGRTAVVYNPATGEQIRRRRPGLGRRDRRGSGGGEGGVSRVALHQPVAARRDPVPHARAGRRQPQGDRLVAHCRARQGALRRDGRGRQGAREHRVRVRHPAPVEGRVQRAGRDRCRRVLDPPAARRRGRHHAVQLPGDGPDVDVRQRPGMRQHVHAQADREGSVGVVVHGRAAAQLRFARRLLQRRAGRQGRRRPAARAPRRGGDQLRRLHTDREVHLRDRDGERQARAGPRRRQEPHARAARRRSRHGRRCRDRCRLRIGRRAVHGDQRRAGGRCDRRRVGRQDRRPHPQHQGRSRQRARQRDGPADHR